VLVLVFAVFVSCVLYKGFNFVVCCFMLKLFLLCVVFVIRLLFFWLGLGCKVLLFCCWLGYSLIMLFCVCVELWSCVDFCK